MKKSACLANSNCILYTLHHTSSTEHIDGLGIGVVYIKTNLGILPIAIPEGLTGNHVVSPSVSALERQ